jgi:hypothetical protein
VKHRAALVPIVSMFAVAGCAEVTYQGYAGEPKQSTDIAVVRLWTATQSNIFSSPGLIVLSIDGVEAGSVGRTSHAYLLPGEHELEIKFIQVKAYNLLCGAICDAIFNKPRIMKVTVAAGHTHTMRYVNDEQGTVALDDRGASYDGRCLLAREYKSGNNC